MNSRNGNTPISSKDMMVKKILKLIILKLQMFPRFFFPSLLESLMRRELTQLSFLISMLIKEETS
jgi:hypothetical protein